MIAGYERRDHSLHLYPSSFPQLVALSLLFSDPVHYQKFLIIFTQKIAAKGTPTYRRAYSESSPQVEKWWRSSILLSTSQEIERGQLSFQNEAQAISIL